MMGRNGNGGVLVAKAQNNEDACDGPSTSQFHVVAVDDSIVDRNVIERLLRISAYQVNAFTTSIRLFTTVDSGRRALEFFGLDKEQNSVNIENIKVNMIITDYYMPGMTGYDLLKKIKVFRRRCRRIYSETGKAIRR
eukprot:TRINITY_DN3360_c0_g1_i3.p1 TRINITY_DN3360_c0_g1~~TRINITY_DN3360_c0_g1_i3.p1  ORF type:complete len:137 (+),score=11.31 TRINITY_DN3360_c0_g1_i3:530-940(+)